MTSMPRMRGGGAATNPFRRKPVNDNPRPPRILTVLTVEDRRASDNQGLARRWTDMSYVVAAPEIMTSAATDLSNIGSALTAAKAAAAAPTTGIVVAAEDEVSAAIAAVFSAHGQGFHHSVRRRRRLMSSLCRR